MLAKRVIAVTPDRALGKRIVAAAMAAGGSAEHVASFEELNGRFDAELFVCAVAAKEDPGIGRLISQVPPNARVVPLIAASDLALMSWLLQNGNVPAVLVAEPVDVPALTATVGKLLYGDLFGLEKVLHWGVKIHSILVGDYQEKARAIAEISELAGAMGVRRKYRENIEQCADELLMNALYDAPVDEHGKQVFAEVAVKDRLAMRVQEKAVVQYACDGDRFALSVRDAYGSIRKATILSFLDKCLHTAGAGQIDRKASGAGLGLYLIANATSQLSFHIFPGVATEVVCTFDLNAARIQLQAFGVFEETLSRGKPMAGPMKMVQRRRREDLVAADAQAARLPRSLVLALSAASALLLFALVMVALPYLRHPASATVRFESEPRGATISVDGRVQGVADAPLAVGGLEAGRSYAVRATLVGRRDDERVVTPAAGEQAMKLSLAPLAAGGVVVESDPPGAQVSVDGKATGQATPATLDLAAGAHAQVTLKKAGFSDATLSVAAGPSGERTVYRAPLALDAEVAALSIEVAPSEPAGDFAPSVSIDGLALVPPGVAHEAFIKPGTSHIVTVAAPGFVTRKQEVHVGGGQRKKLKLVLDPGGAFSVLTNLPLKVSVDGKAVGVTPIEELGLAPGRHAIALRGTKPLVAYDTTETIERGKALSLSLEFGTVTITAAGVTARLPGVAHGSREVALPVGSRSLTLVGPGGEKRERSVEVAAGRKTIIDTF